ncbi:hypothetical protein, partial [Pseudomonas viridiflava]|uniref:hypothetical protein n=1 Tax=Pseudomonas viridiflava TaxID=33069 RepID=UPI001981766A
ALRCFTLRHAQFQRELPLLAPAAFIKMQMTFIWILVWAAQLWSSQSGALSGQLCLSYFFLRSLP